MIYPGGWNALEISEPSPIKPIIAQASVSDAGGMVYGEIFNSTDYFNPANPWSNSPLSINAEPSVFAVNTATFLDEQFKAFAMNSQTKMSNLTNAPPPMSNNIYVYGNKNGVLKYQMIIEISMGAATITSFEISVLENAATNGGANGVVEVYKFDKIAAYLNPVKFYIMFDNYFGQVNLGIRADDATPASSIMPLRCIILDTDPR